MLTFGGPQEPVTPTRARRPPGGASSISLAWCDDGRAGANRQAGSNAFANGARQNCNNVLTDRPTTSVKAPPGGVSSVNLCWDEGSNRNNFGSRTPPSGNGKDAWPGRRQAMRPSPLDFENEEEYDNINSSVPDSRVDERPRFRSDRSGYADRGAGLTPLDLDDVGSDAGGYSNAGWGTGRSGAFAHGASRGYGAASLVSDADKSYTDGTWCSPTRAMDRAPRSDCHGFEAHGNDTISRYSYFSEQRTPKVSSKAERRSEACDSQVGSRTPKASLRGEFTSQARELNLYGSEASYPASRTPKGSVGVTPVASSDAFGRRSRRPSSNAFAQGGNQNRGNMLTETPTTRVCAPPGGASSIHLGGDDFENQPEAGDTEELQSKRPEKARL